MYTYAIPGSIARLRLTKPQLILFHELDAFIDQVGLRNVGFLTLRFHPKVYDSAKAHRRLKRFWDKVLAHHFGHWIATWERYDDRSLHLHLAIDCRADVLSGYDSDLATMGKSNPNENLRRLRRVLHQNTVKYGFGIYLSRDLEPAWSRITMVIYLLNKLSWRKRKAAGKGKKLVQCSPGYHRYFPTKRSAFTLLTPFNGKLRQFTGLVASTLGCADEDAMAAKLGDWRRMVWKYRADFLEFSHTDILDRLDEHRPGWRPSEEFVGDDGQVYELVGEVDEFLDSIAADPGYLTPKPRKCKHGHNDPSQVQKMSSVEAKPIPLLQIDPENDEEWWALGINSDNSTHSAKACAADTPG